MPLLSAKDLTVATFNVVIVPGLPLVFLHSCEIKPKNLGVAWE